jgi:hypothetical protein
MEHELYVYKYALVMYIQKFYVTDEIYGIMLFI